MGEVAQVLVQLSAAGAVMALAVVAVRALLFGQLPKRAFVVLWALVALRLLVPLWVPSPTSVYNALPDGLVGSVAPAAVEAGAAGEADGVADLLPTAGDESLESGLAPSSDAVATPTGADVSRSSASGGSAGTVAVADDAGYGGARASDADAAPADPAASGGAAPEAPAPASAARPGEASLSGWTVAGWVWVAGAALCAAGFLAVYLRARGRLQDCAPVENPFVSAWLTDHRLKLRRLRVVASSDVVAPLARGFVRPAIVVPSSFDWSDEERARCVLAHELAHIRRFDVAAKLLFVAAACAHWFNPLAWVTLVLANRDIEFACDEEAVRSLGVQSRAGYAHALLDMEETRGALAALYSGFGKTGIEKRIGAIMDVKKTSAAALVASVALAVAIPVAFATSAVDAPAAGTSANDDSADGAVTGAPAAGVRADDVPSDDAEPYIATAGTGDAAVRLSIDCTAEEWEELSAFLRDQLAAPPYGENHTTVAQFRADALERFGIPEGGDLSASDLLSRLAADPDLRTLAQSHIPWTTVSDADSAVAAFAYYGLLPLLSGDWEAHAFAGSIPMPGAEGETFAYQMTVRVEDPEVTYVTHVVDNALAFEQRAGDLLEYALEFDPADENELVQSFGVEFRNEFALKVDLYADVSLQLAYAVHDGQGAELASGGCELSVPDEALELRRTTVRQAAAADLFVALEPFGVTYGWVDAAEGDFGGLAYYAVDYDGTPVARIYDPQSGSIVTDLVQLHPDIAYEQAGPDAVDLVVEYDADGELAGVRVAEEGEVEELWAAAAAEADRSRWGSDPAAEATDADATTETSAMESREVAGYMVPETSNSYTDAQWERVIDLWLQVDGNEALTIADFMTLYEEAGFETPGGQALVGRLASDGKLQEVRTTDELASFVCNVLTLLPYCDLFLGNPIGGLATRADGSGMLQYSVIATIDGDPADISALGWQRTLEDTITCIEGVLEQVDADDLNDTQLMGYMLGDLIASGVELHTEGISLTVQGTYTSPSGESVEVSPVAINRVQPAFPVNENGQTYGSAAEAMALGTELPDLIQAEGKNGVTGYVLREDWLGPTPSNPEEALAMMESGAFGPREIPVYAQDGETVVDTMVTG